MKQITKKQMKQLKGMLNDMDYNLSDVNDTVVVPVTDDDEIMLQTVICKVALVTSDID